MKEWTRFNLNEYARFQVGDNARAAYIEYFSIIPSFKESAFAIRFDSMVDEDGFITMQLWQAFSIFGKHMFAGSDIINCGEFYLSTKHLTPPPLPKHPENSGKMQEGEGEAL